jgi:beta-galactosidase
VWAEIPFVNRVSTDESGNAKQQLTELIRQNYNHSSIYVWGLHNEVYEPYNFTAQLTKELHDLAKTEDPGRFTVSVNGYGDINNPSNLHSDIQGINRYFGWYEKKIQDMERWLLNLKNNYPQYKVMLAEYGTEGNINQQVEKVGDVGDCCGPDKNYNETFQTRFHELQWSYIQKNPYLIASYIWNMFDFATPESFQGGVPARNMKGLITFDRKIKKDAFFWYKANWSKTPVLYITQRRVKERTYRITPVTVYSNIGIPTLFVNNKQIRNYVIGNTDVHYIFENIKLRKGKNVIKVVVSQDDVKYEDKVEWTYIEGKEQEVLETPEKKGVHTGLIVALRKHMH